MTQVWSDDGTGDCQFCGNHVSCGGTWLDERFRPGYENHAYQIRDCSGCGRFRITGSAQSYRNVPKETLRAVSQWIRKERLSVPEEGWDNLDLPLVTSGLVDSLKPSRP